jgi:hypothetical protein
MTIDEAISHAREVAECQKMSARLIDDNAYIPESVDKEAITYGNTICANEHEQLAEWLEELKQYRTIGTPEECRAAMEKQKEKNPIRLDKCTCPSCGTYNEVWKKRRNTLPSDIVYCWHCGQAVEIFREASDGKIN